MLWEFVFAVWVPMAWVPSVGSIPLLCACNGPPSHGQSSKSDWFLTVSLSFLTIFDVASSHLAVESLSCWSSGCFLAIYSEYTQVGAT